MSHVLQGLTEISSRATIISIDGVSAKRRRGIRDPLMPLLFAVGQHGVLAATQESLQAGERLVAFFDDIYTVILPERVGHFRQISGDTRGSQFMEARRKCGTLQVSTSWNESPG